MAQYDIKANFITTIDFPVIKAKNKKEAIEKAEELLYSGNPDIKELYAATPAWKAIQIN